MVLIGGDFMTVIDVLLSDLVNGETEVYIRYDFNILA